MICEPLELEYVASSLLQKGQEVDLVDMLLEKKPLKWFLQQKDYDMVCMTAYITCVCVVKEYAKIVKQYHPNIITCVGGVHAEVVPNDFVDENIDYILWANGVQTLVDMVESYPDMSVENLPGVYLPGREKPPIVNGMLPFQIGRAHV